MNDYPSQEATNGELGEAEKESNRSVNKIRRAGRTGHRPHQVLEDPPASTTGAPCTHFEQTITAALSLHAFKTIP